MWWLYLVLFLISLLIVYLQNVHNYWQKRGVPTARYKYYFGNMGSALLFRKSISEVFVDIYNQFHGYKYVGVYKFTQPAILVRDPEILKDVLLKNFNSFHDNDIDIDEKNDLIFGKNPFALKGEKWKVTRGQLTPCFSSSKMKTVMPLLQANAKKMLKYLEDVPEATNGVGLEAKELCSKYTCENVASCAFGLEGGCFTDPKSEFREKGKQLLSPSFWNGIKLMVVFMFPSLSKLLKIKFVSDEVKAFFQNIVTQTLQYRKSNDIKRNDFLDFMTDIMAKVNDEKEFNLNDITAHAGGFFGDGYETSSIVISFALYELATNPDVQERLRRELDEVLSRHDNQFTYEAIQEMDYLECVLKESLRKNSPVLSLSKVCTEQYELPPLREGEPGPVIEPGVPLIVPIDGLHMNPEFFPEPTRFNPDRFADNGKNIVKCTYLPFGEGARMCLGFKFGVLQSKLAIAAIVANYHMKANDRTKEPLVLDSSYFLRSPIGGLWLNFTKRN